VRRRVILAVMIAGAMFGVVAAPALAQNSESAPAAAALMKSKPKTPAGGTAMVRTGARPISSSSRWSRAAWLTGRKC
jgi:hypothetical protein